MIAEQSVSIIAEQSVSCARPPIWRQLLKPLVSLSPGMPYAALWAASRLAKAVSQPDFYEPDKYTMEAPFLSDSWPFSR